jgi:hypothetical protein
LTALDDSGHVVHVEQNSFGNSVNFTNWDTAFLVADGTIGTAGAGSDSQITYGIAKTILYDGSLPWEQRPPIVGLWHELIHAWNAATGTCQPGFGAGWARLLELQCVGLPLPDTALLWDNDNNPATPPAAGNPPPFTENDWRAFLGLLARPQY